MTAMTSTERDPRDIAAVELHDDVCLGRPEREPEPRHTRLDRGDALLREPRAISLALEHQRAPLDEQAFRPRWCRRAPRARTQSTRAPRSTRRLRDESTAAVSGQGPTRANVLDLRDPALEGR